MYDSGPPLGKRPNRRPAPDPSPPHRQGQGWEAGGIRVRAGRRHLRRLDKAGGSPLRRLQRDAAPSGTAERNRRRAGRYPLRIPADTICGNQRPDLVQTPSHSSLRPGTGGPEKGRARDWKQDYRSECACAPGSSAFSLTQRGCGPGPVITERRGPFSTAAP